MRGGPRPVNPRTECRLDDFNRPYVADYSSGALGGVFIWWIPKTAEFWFKVENGGDFEQTNLERRAMGAD